MTVRLLIAAALIAQVTPVPAIGIKVVRLTSRVIQFTVDDDGYVEQLNCVAVIGERHVLLFDTTTRPSTARRIIGELAKITDKPVKFVVNSHWHPDHWSGNEAVLEAFPEAIFVATTTTAQFMRHAAPAWPSRFRAILAQRSEKETSEDLALYSDFVREAARIRRIYPTLTFERDAVIDSGDLKMDLLRMQGDADGTAVAYLPSEGVVISGDLIVRPIPFGTSSPTRLLSDLIRLRALNAKIIVPGHGAALHDMSYLNAEIAVLQQVKEGVSRALQNGAATLKEVEDTIDAAALQKQFSVGETVPTERFRQWVHSLVMRAIRDAREQDYSI